MEEKRLAKLLKQRKEKDWLEFKSRLELYQSDGTLVPQKRDEFLKDIIGLANGNAFIVRETKYLIIGVDDKKFDETGLRILHNVDYQTPSESEIVKWLSSASSPAIVGLKCEVIKIGDVSLLVITIPPTFDLHETTRELITPSANFTKFTVFMRQDEHVIPASVRDGITILERKHLYRREIANPSPILIGTITGVIVGMMIGATEFKTVDGMPFERPIFFIASILIGLFFGAGSGLLARIFLEARYDFRYMTIREKLIFLGFILVAVVFSLFTYFR